MRGHARPMCSASAGTGSAGDSAGGGAATGASGAVSVLSGGASPASGAASAPGASSGPGGTGAGAGAAGSASTAADASRAGRRGAAGAGAGAGGAWPGVPRSSLSSRAARPSMPGSRNGRDSFAATSSNWMRGSAWPWVMRTWASAIRSMARTTCTGLSWLACAWRRSSSSGASAHSSRACAPCCSRHACRRWVTRPRISCSGSAPPSSADSSISKAPAASPWVIRSTRSKSVSRLTTPSRSSASAISTVPLPNVAIWSSSPSASRYEPSAARATRSRACGLASMSSARATRSSTVIRLATPGLRRA